MTIELNTQDLQRAIKDLKPAIRANTVTPALEYILVKSDSNTAVLRATDLNLEITVTIGSRGEGTFLLPFGEIEKVVGTFTDDFVVVDINQKRLQVKADGDVFDMPTEEAVMFPERKEYGGKMVKKFPIKEDIINALKLAIKNSSDDENNPRLNGCCINFLENSTCDIVGTTGRVVYKKNLPYTGTGTYHIPKAFVDAISTGQYMQITEKAITIFNGTGTTTCILPEDEFVDYPMIYQAYTGQPANLKMKLSIIMSKLNRIVNYSDTSVSKIILEFNEDDLLGSSVNLSYVNPDTEKVYRSGSIGCENKTGIKKIAFLSNQLKTILETCGEESVEMFLIEEKKPVYLIAPQQLHVISSMEA